MTHSHDDERLEQEAMDQLAKANPIIPGDNDPSNDALLRRITSETSRTNGGWQRRVALAFGGFAALAIIAGGSFAVLGGGGDGSDGGQVPADQTDGDATVDPAGGGVIGSCLAYSSEELVLREHAFHGEATEVTDTTVTFDVIEWYSAEGDASITLVVDSTLSSDTYRDFPFDEGEEYLVSGDAEFAWGCGFTRPYEEALAAEWNAAFGG